MTSSIFTGHQEQWAGKVEKDKVTAVMTQSAAQCPAARSFTRTRSDSSCGLSSDAPALPVSLSPPAANDTNQRNQES